MLCSSPRGTFALSPGCFLSQARLTASCHLLFSVPFLCDSSPPSCLPQVPPTALPGKREEEDAESTLEQVSGEAEVTSSLHSSPLNTNPMYMHRGAQSFSPASLRRGVGQVHGLDWTPHARFSSLTIPTCEDQALGAPCQLCLAPHARLSPTTTLCAPSSTQGHGSWGRPI